MATFPYTLIHERKPGKALAGENFLTCQARFTIKVSLKFARNIIERWKLMRYTVLIHWFLQDRNICGSWFNKLNIVKATKKGTPKTSVTLFWHACNLYGIHIFFVNYHYKTCIFFSVLNSFPPQGREQISSILATMYNTLYTFFRH